MGIRLNKVLSQLNIGIHTAVEFLKTHHVGELSDNASPNTKITDEQYYALVRGFGTESQKEKIPTNRMESWDYDSLMEGFNQTMKSIGDELLHKLDERKQSSPIHNKKDPRVIKLPQPIAQLACSGLMENIETSYLGSWKPGDVLLVYAEDETPEFMTQLEGDVEKYAVYYNALLFGNLQYPIYSSAYIGLIELGSKSFKYYHKRYVNIVGAELLDEPLDNKPVGMVLNNTHTFKYRNIILENDVVKIPLSEMGWEMIESDNYLRFFWESKFKGFVYVQNNYSYLFYSEKGEKLFVPAKSNSLDEEEDEFDEAANTSVFQGKDNEGIKYLCFDLDKLEEKPIKNSSFDILQRKEWILDWKCVNFKNGMIIIYAPADGTVKFKPKSVGMKGSLESFNYLKDYLNERLSPVRCYVENMELTIYDNIRLNEAIEKFAEASRQRGIKVVSHNTQTRIAPLQMSFSQALSKAQQMTPEDFKKYKSEYIDYLVSQQSKTHKVIPCVERLAHTNSDMTEYAFIFTIECKSGDILIVHENVNPDRSTLLFIVKPENYDKAIRAVYDFLQSAEINKRSSLRDRGVELGESGIVRYRSINHDYLFSWKRIISSYKLHYKNGYVFYY